MPSQKNNKTEDTMRLNQYLAKRGIASRREADEFIEKGKVLVNGKKAVLGQKINPVKDVVDFQGKASYVYYAYNKPKGIVTTTPQKGEKDILKVTRFPQKVFPIGRLDKDSHGLIIMTNDRKLTTHMLGPTSTYDKEYIVTIQEKVTDHFLDFLRNGVTLDDGTKTKKCKASKIAPDKFSITLLEGKNRQIRRMVDAYKYHVEDLKRIRIGKVFIRDLKPGLFRSIAPKELF